MGCEIAAHLLKQVLEQLDEEISEKREKSIYRHKGIRKTTIRTLMGEVEVKRRIYQVHKEEGSLEHRYLLDEELGMQVIGKISMNLAERIIHEVSQASYRNTAINISELSNQSISHQGVWNLVQNTGQVIKRVEQELVTAHRQAILTGETEIRVLLEEADGIWISMQGASRPKRGNGKKELKIGCTYEGWKERYSGSKEYTTVNKHTIAGMMTSNEFHAVKEAALAQKYNLDEIQYRILNGDGVNWIKQIHENDDTIHYQLDSYHLSTTVIKAVGNKQAAVQIFKWLRSGQAAKALDNIQHLKYQCDEMKSDEPLERVVFWCLNTTFVLLLIMLKKPIISRVLAFFKCRNTCLCTLD